MDRYVFFDFDGTLTRRDTFFGFLRHLHGSSGMMRILLAESPAILRGMLKDDEGEAKERVLIRALRGMEPERFRRACLEYGASIERIEREPIVKALDEAESKGDKVAIVSASIGDWIRPWAEAHRVKHVIATECETRDKARLGRFVTPNCIRGEKVRRILEEFPKLANQRGDCHVTAYGNSGGDREMLAFADKAIKIN